MNNDGPDNSSPPVYGQPPPRYEEPTGMEPTGWQRFKKLLAPVGVALLLIVKFSGKIKFLILPVLKFLPVVLKTGGTMLLSIAGYAMLWGVWFALGFVGLIFVHECGHLLAAKRIGLKVGAPVFIPFMGAVIALKEAPRNAWIEAQVGIGGPVLGTLGAAVCEGIFQLTGNSLFRALAHVGFMLNLFNLAPISPLDGGRVVTALSPWLWLVGVGVVAVMLFNYPNFLLLLVLLFSLPRLFSLFRSKTEAERRYFEVTPAQRWFMAALYFGLVAFLVWGMEATYVAPHAVSGGM